MSDYLPLYLPGDAITGTTSADVTGGGLVYVSGSGTVANTATAASLPIGVAGFDAPSGESVTYFGRGTVHRLTASGGVTAGDLVTAAAAGAVAKLAAVTTPTAADVTNTRAVFGIALTTALTGAAVEIMEV